MEKIKNVLKNFISYFQNENMPLEVKNLYIITFFSLPGCISFLGIFIAANLPLEVIYISIGMILFFACVGYLLIRFDDYVFLKYLLVIVMNFLLFPVIFYITGDIYNGGILFFPLGLVCTFFLISEKWVYLIAIAELVWYCVILYFPIIWYDDFERFRNIVEPGTGIAPSFLLAAVVPIMMIVYQTSIYNKTHKQLEDASRVIDEAKFNKSRFLANMTHEIRTPMNAIIGMNELILRENLDSESRELAENIRASSNQLLKIINNILEFSKLDSNKMELYLQKYDFRELISEVINAVSREYISSENKFFADIDPDIPRILFGDSVRVKQIFTYILFSAISKLPHNRIVLKVKGDVNYNTNSVLLSCVIAESGLGLSEDEVEAMLSAYTKYDSRQKSDFKGMGLEISICKEILQMMGGNIEIDSVEGVGMAIKFDFLNYIIEEVPIARIDTSNEYNVLVYSKNSEDDDTWINVLSDFQIYPNFVNGPNSFKNAIENKRYTHIFVDEFVYDMLSDTIRAAEIEKYVFVVTEGDLLDKNVGNCKLLRRPLTCINVSEALNYNLEAANSIPSKKEMITYPQAKVLIVDDSIVNLKVLEGMLKSFKINVTKCTSGAEALALLDKDYYDMLILDQRMPEMDGVELLEHVRGLDNVNSKAPVLCATADFGPEIERKLIGVGFQDYLAKPIRKHYLENMLRKFIPQELAVVELIDEEEKTKVKSKKEEAKETKEDPLVIHYDKGLEIVGGNKEAFLDVLVSYYKEGLKKLTIIDDLLVNDVSLYVVEVHALKSSSAAIGATGISAMFKDLEFAGRAVDMDFLNAHTRPTLDSFEKVIDKIREYLESNGISLAVAEDEPKGATQLLDIAIVDEIIEALAKFNLKLCEDKLKEQVTINYGTEINSRFREILNSYEQFDYHRVKDELAILKDSLG